MQVDDNVDMVSTWQPAINNALGSASQNMADYAANGDELGGLFGAVVIGGFLVFSVVVIIAFFYFALKKAIS